MFDYTDPYGQARQARESVPQSGVSPWPQNGQSWIQEPPAVPQAPAGPMGDLQGQMAQVFQGAAPRGIRHYSMAEEAAKGAAIGVGAALLWRGMKARKARVGTWTTPLAMATVIWWVLSAVTVVVQAALQSWAVLIGGFAVSTVVACWYLRRKGVPRRARHRPF